MLGLDAILGISTQLISRLIPDPTQADAARLKLLEIQQSGELAQITGQLEINKMEASSSSLFVSGWRPAIGWICALALFYQYLARPLTIGLLIATGHESPQLPGLDENLWQLLLGMLGLGGLRTFEKINGASK